MNDRLRAWLNGWPTRKRPSRRWRWWWSWPGKVWRPWWTRRRLGDRNFGTNGTPPSSSSSASSTTSREGLCKAFLFLLFSRSSTISSSMIPRVKLRVSFNSHSCLCSNFSLSSRRWVELSLEPINFDQRVFLSQHANHCGKIGMVSNFLSHSGVVALAIVIRQDTIVWLIMSCHIRVIENGLCTNWKRLGDPGSKLWFKSINQSFYVSFYLLFYQSFYQSIILSINYLINQRIVPRLLSEKRNDKPPDSRPKWWRKEKDLSDSGIEPPKITEMFHWWMQTDRVEITPYCINDVESAQFNFRIRNMMIENSLRARLNVAHIKKIVLKSY